jgi:hypothetical protein
MATQEDPREVSARVFEETRQNVVRWVEEARDNDWDEDALAVALEQVAEISEADLNRLAEHYAEDERVMFGAVEAWASVASYASSRFYVDGPESFLKRGGESKRVSDSLHDLTAKWSPFLRSACAATKASSFSIAVGFPLGVSIGLTWGS